MLEYMSNIKVAFLSHHFESPEKLLETILKMTPGRSGKWKNIEATTKINEADFYWIMDGYNYELPDAKNKAIYFGEHPYTPYSPTYKNFEGKQALLKLPLQHFLNPGESWIEYDYDYLSKLLPNKNRKPLVCVVTYQTHHKMYHQRPKFVAEFVRKYPNVPLDVYGRPSENFRNDEVLKNVYRGVLGNENYDPTKGEHIVGKNVIENYDYTLEFDVGPCKNYFSERFYDSLYLWCTPIYFGCTNLSDHLPHEGKAFYTFDQNNLEDVHKVAAILNEPKHYKEIAEVRDILLNKYQMWAYCHEVVNNIPKYLELQKNYKIR